MAGKTAEDGILKVEASRLASSKKIVLLDALSDFVNLKGSTPLTRDIQPEDVRRFRLKHPNFFPKDCYDVAESSATSTWPGFPEPDPDRPHAPLLGLQYFRCYQDWLRALWRGRRAGPRWLDILLGLEPDCLSPLPSIGRDGWLPRAKSVTDWRAGAIRYEAACDFQRAVWELFRQRWRAKVCGECFKLFIADKPAQRFCGISCSALAEKTRKLGWWREHGEAWRKTRNASTKRLQRKRGK